MVAMPIVVRHAGMTFVPSMLMAAMQAEGMGRSIEKAAASRRRCS
jgi:hypothetical protein